MQTSSDEHWSAARRKLARDRPEDARIQALWAGVAAYEEGVPLSARPQGDALLTEAWQAGWQMLAARAAAASLPPVAIRLPYADD